VLLVLTNLVTLPVAVCPPLSVIVRLTVIERNEGTTSVATAVEEKYKLDIGIRCERVGCENR